MAEAGTSPVLTAARWVHGIDPTVRRITLYAVLLAVGILAPFLFEAYRFQIAMLWVMRPRRLRV